MTSIRENQENEFASNGLRKDVAEAPKNQRRVLGGISQNSQNINQQRILKSKGQNNQINIRNDDNICQLNNIKNKANLASSSVVPPVAQFQAFSVYEDTVDEKSKVLKETKNHEKREEKQLPLSVLSVHPQKPPLPQFKNDDINVDSPMSVGLDSSILCPMSISQSDTKSSPNEEKKATAKTVRELFFHVAEYRDEIYKYMRGIEWKHRPKPGYMRKQPDISHSMRSILVDWLVEVGEEYHLHTETLYLAVSYIDRFLSYMSVVRAKLQLVGTAAMFIASKYEEIYPPVLGEFVYITDDTYTKQQVLRMEHLILKVLSFDLSTPTPLAFINHFCIANGLSQKTMFLAMYIAELSLLEAEPYLHFPSSILAASSLVVARHTLLCCHCEKGKDHVDCNNSVSGADVTACEDAAWPDQLRRCSGYTPAQLEKCVRHLEKTHLSSLTISQRAIPDKYKNIKYEAVSLIQPKPMYPPMDPEEKSFTLGQKLNESDNSIGSTQSKQIIEIDDSIKKSLKES